jgi:hypothetical protein
MKGLDQHASRAAGKAGAGRIWQILFVAWLIFVNALYYLQFRDLAAGLLSRIRLWR